MIATMKSFIDLKKSIKTFKSMNFHQKLFQWDSLELINSGDYLYLWIIYKSMFSKTID